MGQLTASSFKNCYDYSNFFSASSGSAESFYDIKILIIITYQ